MTNPESTLLEELLSESAQRHRHLCPRQVLGVRIGLRGLRELGLVDQQGCPRFRNTGKRLLVVAETDGCSADGIAVATDTAVGRRTLRILDYGKVAATLIDRATNRAVRVHPTASSRALAQQSVPDAESRWHAYLEAYQQIADDELLEIAAVRLQQSIAEIMSKPDARALCDNCGEEIFNEREVIGNGMLLCRHCAGDRYYSPL